MKIAVVGLGMVGSAYARYLDRSHAFTLLAYDKYKTVWDGVHLNTAFEIARADIVLICVPTPNGPLAQDSSAVIEAVSLVGKGQIAVIKSTVLPGTAEVLQRAFPKVRIVSSPEFLSEATAEEDVRHPILTLIGTSDPQTQREVRSVLPSPPESTFLLSPTEAELVKYTHNIMAYLNILGFNILHDVGVRVGANWANLKSALDADPMLASTYANPIHNSGRGAGGHCFIKDFEAFRRMVGDHPSADLLVSAVRYNWHLLQSTGKSLPILDANYPKR